MTYLNLFLSVFMVLSGFQQDKLLAQVEAKEQITVYLFLLDECVISTNYTKKLNELYNEYGNNFDFIAVFPNFSSKPAAIEHWKQKYHVDMEHRTDYFKTLTRKLGATVTPEVVVYNEETDKVIYRGRIDDQYAALGRRRRFIQQDELATVLAELSNGNPVNVSDAPAIGCLINFNDELNK